MYGHIVHRTITGKHYEKEKSTRDRSVRELVLGPHHIYHRFEHKDFISGSYLLADNLSRYNILLARLNKGGYK